MNGGLGAQQQETENSTKDTNEAKLARRDLDIWQPETNNFIKDA